jgi:hypothetical protein
VGIVFRLSVLGLRREPTWKGAASHRRATLELVEREVIPGFVSTLHKSGGARSGVRPQRGKGMLKPKRGAAAYRDT